MEEAVDGEVEEAVEEAVEEEVDEEVEHWVVVATELQEISLRLS